MPINHVIIKNYKNLKNLSLGLRPLMVFIKMLGG
jgi:predicted ATPase